MYRIKLSILSVILTLVFSNSAFTQSWKHVGSERYTFKVSSVGNYSLFKFKNQLFVNCFLYDNILQANIPTTFISINDTVTNPLLYDFPKAPNMGYRLNKYSRDDKYLYITFSKDLPFPYAYIYGFDGSAVFFIDSINQALTDSSVEVSGYFSTQVGFDFVLIEKNGVEFGQQEYKASLFKFEQNKINRITRNGGTTIYNIIDGIKYTNSVTDTFGTSYGNPTAYDGQSFRGYPSFINVKAVDKFKEMLVVSGDEYFGMAPPSPIAYVRLNTPLGWVDIGDTRMGPFGGNKILVHKDKLYAYGQLNDFKSGYVFVYDGFQWNPITSDRINKRVKDAIVYKDELYIAGDFDSIGSMQFFGIAKIKLLNDANVAPSVRGETINMLENTADTLHIKQNDTDLNGDYLLTKILQQAKHGKASILPSDDLFYTPDSQYYGIDSILYQLCDQGGMCGQAWVVMNIQSVNDAPRANEDFAEVELNTKKTFNPLENDYDPDGDPMTLSILTQAQNGSSILKGNTIEYTPNTGYLGKDYIKYQVCDNNGGCDFEWIYISVVNGNEAIICNDDTFLVDSYDQTYIDALKNDIYSQSDYLATVLLQKSPKNGVAGVSNEKYVYYQAKKDFVAGIDSFTYLLRNNAGTVKDSAWVYINFQPKVGIDNQLNSTELNLYPNPVSDLLVLDFSKPIDFTHSTVYCYTFLGAEVFSKPLSAEKTTIDVSNLPTGAYLLKVVSGNSILHKKLQIIK